MSTRQVRYALAGGMLGLGAPAGLLLFRLLRRGLSVRSAGREIGADLETYFFAGASTTLALAMFGGILGRFADRLAQLAMTDSLTHLFNARAFDERLHQELERAARYHEPLSLLMIDLDGLKRVNDTYGHEAGDAALRSIASVIRLGLREIDVGARLGGDEFAVLAPSTDAESALVLAERLRALVAKRADGRTGRGTTISIGSASLAPSGGQVVTATALMTAADEALYQAKRQGGNRVVTIGRRHTA
ncbi:MAG: GGDEF domain-containing protein [Betaproteobacteria bacterium]